MKKPIIYLLLAFAPFFSRAQEAPAGLSIHSKAPDFKAMDQYGKEVQLKNILKTGKKTVLVFYRGNWCPFCNRHLKRLEDSLQLIKDKGAELIAITPENTEGVDKTIKKTKASYPILHDADMKIMKAYKVEFQVPDNTITRYRNGGLDLEKINGGKSLPVPAIYIIDKESTIIYRFFDEDYKKRPSVQEILNNL